MMLAALASFTLIFTPNNGGPITVIEGLSENACKEALSFAEYGRTTAEREAVMEAFFAQERAARAARGEKEDPNSTSSNYAEAMLGMGRCIPFYVNSDANASANASANGGDAATGISTNSSTTIDSGDSNSTMAGGGVNPTDPGTPNSSIYRMPASKAPPVVNRMDPMTYSIGVSSGIFSPLFPTKVFRYGDKK